MLRGWERSKFWEASCQTGTEAAGRDVTHLQSECNGSVCAALETFCRLGVVQRRTCYCDEYYFYDLEKKKSFFRSDKFFQPFDMFERIVGLGKSSRSVWQAFQKVGKAPPESDKNKDKSVEERRHNESN